MPKPESIAPRPNFDPQVHAMFQYGPTKCAVILKDMVESFDQYMNRPYASKKVGRAMAKVDQMLRMTELDFLDRMGRRRVNLLNKDEPVNFKEHLVRELIDSVLYSGEFPESMINIFRAVCNEKINSTKLEHGLIKAKRGIEYNSMDLPEWSKRKDVVLARNRFKMELRTKDKSQKELPCYYS